MAFSHHKLQKDQDWLFKTMLASQPQPSLFRTLLRYFLGLFVRQEQQKSLELSPMPSMECPMQEAAFRLFCLSFSLWGHTVQLSSAWASEVDTSKIIQLVTLDFSAGSNSHFSGFWFLSDADLTGMTLGNVIKWNKQLITCLISSISTAELSFWRKLWKFWWNNIK